MLISLVKRFVPFVITLALGLFVASFFVNLRPTVPSMKFERHYQYKKSCWNNKAQFEREDFKREFERREMQDEFPLNKGEIDFDRVAPIAPAAPTVPRDVQ